MTNESSDCEFEFTAKSELNTTSNVVSSCFERSLTSFL